MCDCINTEYWLFGSVVRNFQMSHFYMRSSCIYLTESYISPSKLKKYTNNKKDQVE